MQHESLIRRLANYSPQEPLFLEEHQTQDPAITVFGTKAVPGLTLQLRFDLKRPP